MSHVSPVPWLSLQPLADDQAPSRHLEVYPPFDAPTKPIDSNQLSTRLHRILNNAYLYRLLLDSRGSDAQALLNLLQSLLDTRDLDAHFRRSLIKATQRLSKKSGLYPICYELKGVRQIDDDPVAAGGFADIYKGEFEGQVVCLRVIRLYRDRHLEHLLKEFSKEVILWGQLSHVNVLPMYGLYRFRRRLCLVAPWMENGDLEAYLEQNPKADRCSLTADITRGLTYLHKNKIVHGDLKGRNILIDAAGRARVSDFGIACISDPDIVAWTSLSSMSSKGGSLRWHAPELFDLKNNEAVKNSTFSDIYALGCVFYETYTGNVPFHNISREAIVMHQIQHGSRPLRPPKTDPAWQEWGLTEAIWALIQECWGDDPFKRPSIKQVMNRLDLPLEHDDGLEIRGPITSSMYFRHRMSEPLDEVSMSASEKLLNNILESRITIGERSAHGASNPSGQELSNNLVHCSQCHTIDSTFWSKDERGQTICNICYVGTIDPVNNSRPAAPASVVIVPPSPKQPSLVISPSWEADFKNKKEESDEAMKNIGSKIRSLSMLARYKESEERIARSKMELGLITPTSPVPDTASSICESPYDETSVLAPEATNHSLVVQTNFLSVPLRPQNGDLTSPSAASTSSYGADDEANDSGGRNERIDSIGKKEKRRRSSIS